MTNFIIAYDNQDSKLGAYFEACKTALVTFLQDYNYDNVTEIPASYCTQPYIELKLAQFKNTEFCFIAYSHGREDSVVCAEEAYVRSNENTNLFSGSLFFTNSCLSGKKLGLDLIDSGTKVFFGYLESINICYDYLSTFIKCDNAALYFFVGENKSVEESYQSAISVFNQEIDKIDLFKNWEMLNVQAELTYARDSLVYYGAKDFRIKKTT